jgi:hypothetical protein
VALAPGFTQLNVAVIQVANLADRGKANLADQAYFTGRQAYLGVIALFRQQLCGSPSRSRQLAAFAFG